LSGDAVKLTEVGSEAEAAMLCGYLESLGIHATYDKGGVTTGVLGSYSGPNVGRQEIVVEAGDLAAAREALATMNQAKPDQ
jgi:hypothetical protein